MKVLFAGSYGIPANYGGTETCVEEIGSRLAKLGIDVTVISYPIKQGPFKYKNMKRIPIIRTHNKILDFPLRNLITIFKVLSGDYDIIHFFGADAAPFVFFLKILKKKTILTLDSLPWLRISYPYLLKKILQLTAKLSLYSANAIVIDSKTVQKWYSKYNKKTIYIPYGTMSKPTDKLTPANKNFIKKLGLEVNNYFLIVARFVKEKGIETAIKAYNEINTDVPLVIVGSDKENGKYERYLKSLVTTKNIKFFKPIYGYGYISLTKGAKAILNTSIIEGSSPALIQSLASNSIIIASDIPPNREVLGDSGLYFKAKDVNSLKDILLKVLDNEERYKIYREKSLIRAKNIYSWDLITNQYLSIYKNLISNNEL